MFFLRVNRDELTDQSTGPVVEGNLAADAGAVKTDSPAIAQGAVYVIVAGDKRGVFTALPGVDDLLRILQVLIGRCRFVFHDDLLFRNSLPEKIAGHSLCFGHGLIASLSAGWDHDRRRGIFLIYLDCLVQAIAQKL